MGRRSDLEGVEKKKKSYRDSNPDPSVVQPVASRYTDCSVPVILLVRNIFGTCSSVGERP
jgi:hypothetical protein